MVGDGGFTAMSVSMVRALDLYILCYNYIACYNRIRGHDDSCLQSK